MNKLRALRGERGLSIQAVADGAGINQATISLIENGHRKAQVQTAGKLAAFFGVPIEVFSDITDNTAAARGLKGQKARQAKENKEMVTIDAELMAELDRCDAETEEFTLDDVIAELDVLLKQLDSQPAAVAIS